MSNKTSRKRREQRKRAKEKEVKMSTGDYTSWMQIPKHPPVMFGFDMFGPLMAYPAAQPQPKKKEETMNTASVINSVTASETQEEKAFKRILNRMTQAFYQHENDLRKEHGLIDEPRPETAKELVERIKSGKFIVDAKYEDYRCYNPSEYITWRDPKIEKDVEGFDKAFKALDKKYQSALDKIYISTGEEGLKVFESFEKGK